MRTLLSVSVALFLTLSGLAPSSASQKRRLVGNMKNPNVVGGCGCYFSFSLNSRGSMFRSSAADRDNTWMNIDGVDTKLKFVSETEPSRTDARGFPKVGSRHTKKYTADNITVDVVFITASVCGPQRADEPPCEGTDYSAIFKVRKGQRTQVVKAVGGCGC